MYEAAESLCLEAAGEAAIRRSLSPVAERLWARGQAFSVYESEADFRRPQAKSQGAVHRCARYKARAAYEAAHGDPFMTARSCVDVGFGAGALVAGQHFGGRRSGPDEALGGRCEARPDALQTDVDSSTGEVGARRRSEGG